MTCLLPDDGKISCFPDRAEVGRLAATIQDATDESVELAYVDQEYTGEKPAGATRCRRLVKDYERYASTLASLHAIAFACFMPRNAAMLTQGA